MTSEERARLRFAIAIGALLGGLFVLSLWMSPVFAEEHYQWSLMGADGEMWDYITVDTWEEIKTICGWAYGCTQPIEHKVYALESVRYSASDKPCLTVEDHELLHVLGWRHADMILLCFDQLMEELKLKYPTNNVAHLEQMALRMQVPHQYR